MKTYFYLIVALVTAVFIFFIITAHRHPQKPRVLPLKSHRNFFYDRYPDKWDQGSHDWYGLKNRLDAALFNAVIENNLNAATRLITQGADVNALVDNDQPHSGYMPLKIALDTKSHAMAHLLLEAGAQVNAVTDTGGIADEIGTHPPDDVRNNTVLAYAIILNDPEMVKLLLQYGADINKPDPLLKKWTPLKIARYNNRIEILKILVDASAQE